MESKHITHIHLPVRQMTGSDFSETAKTTPQKLSPNPRREKLAATHRVKLQ